MSVSGRALTKQSNAEAFRANLRGSFESASSTPSSQAPKSTAPYSSRSSRVADAGAYRAASCATNRGTPVWSTGLKANLGDGGGVIRDDESEALESARLR